MYCQRLVWTLPELKSECQFRELGSGFQDPAAGQVAVTRARCPARAAPWLHSGPWSHVLNCVIVAPRYLDDTDRFIENNTRPQDLNAPSSKKDPRITSRSNTKPIAIELSERIDQTSASSKPPEPLSARGDIPGYDILPLPTVFFAPSVRAGASMLLTCVYYEEDTSPFMKTPSPAFEFLTPSILAPI